VIAATQPIVGMLPKESLSAVPSMFREECHREFEQHWVTRS
jgi:hypothetical protein